MNSLTQSNQIKLKPYWQRTGGPFGIVAGLIGAGFLGFYLLPILTTIIWNTVNFVLACIVGGLLGWVILDGQIFKQFFFIYESLMKKIWGIFIETNPFLIGRMDIENQRKKLVSFNTNVDLLNGNYVELNNQIKEAIKEKEECLDLIKSAQNIQKDGQDASREIRINAAKIGALDEQIRILTPLKEQSKIVSQQLRQIHEHAITVIAEQETKLDIQEKTFNFAQKGAMGLQKAMGLFSSDPDQQRLKAQADEYIRSEIAMNLGKIDKNLSLTTNIIRDIQLKNGVLEQRGLKIINELATDKTKLLSDNLIQDIDYQPIQEQAGKPTLSVYKDILGD